MKDLEFKGTQSNWKHKSNPILRNEQIVFDEHGTLLARIPNTDISKKEAEANAKLMASAPELLEALIQLDNQTRALLKRLPIPESKKYDQLAQNISDRLVLAEETIKKALN